MAATNKRLVEGSQLTTTAATYYSAPSTTTTLLKKVTVTNTSGAAATVTLYLVPSGGTAGATNTVTSAKSIPAGGYYEAYEAEGHVLAPGDSLQALANTAAAVTLMVSGIEVV